MSIYYRENGVLKKFNINANDVQVLDVQGKYASTNLEDVLAEVGSGTATNMQRIEDMIDNMTNVIPSVNYGMNNKITNDGTVSVMPKFTINGKTVINLLGKDGNCEDVSKWTVSNNVLSLDTSNKIFGSNSIKVVGNGAGLSQTYRDINPLIDKTKYYCASAYLKYVSGANAHISTWNGTSAVSGQLTTDNTKFIRVFLKLKPSDFGASYTNLILGSDSVNGSTFYMDGIMLEEITLSQYNDSSFVPSPYVDSYACLQNPYIEVRQDNMVINGNGESIGINGWYDSFQQNDTFDGTYFKVNTPDTGLRWIEQIIPAKPNTNYTFSSIAKAGTSYARVILRYLDGDRNGLTGSSGSSLPIDPYDSTVSSTSETTLTQTITTTQSTKFIKIYLGAYNTSGYSYFRQISLVEGNIAPTSYKSCRIEKCVLETKLTSNDSITYDNGEVSGQIWWKHRTLFGKDYDLGVNADFTGFKRLQMTAFITNVGNSISDSLVKFNGDMMSNVSACNGLNQFANNGTGTYINVSDSETGWTDTLNPTNDEVKAFMNGWKTTSVNVGTGRYVFWQSIIDNSIPSSVPQTTVSTAYVANSATLLVADGTKFSVGDWILVCNSALNYQYVLTQITAISGNTLTIGAYSSAIPVGSIVARADNGTTDTRILTWCKNNVASGYEGYQIHYKLATPESITDGNCRVKGDIPKLDIGDNYLYLDSGMVLGEVANIQMNGDAYINGTGLPLKYKTERIFSVYKNNIESTQSWLPGYDANWKFIGNEYRKQLIANYDANANYTVDYKILSVNAPSIGTISCSFSKDIITSINKLEESMNNKQTHDSTLDQLIDGSIYENLINGQDVVFYGRGHNVYGVYQIPYYIPMIPKKSTPIITMKINSLRVYDAIGGYIDVPLADTSYDCYFISKSLMVLRVWYTGFNATIKSNMLNYASRVSLNTLTADCRGRI